MSVETLGIGPKGVNIYEPSGAAGRSLPVIVFLHGYYFYQIDEVYTDFIRHLVRKGYIVIYPFYQNVLTPGSRYTSNAAYGITTALTHIVSDPSRHAQPKYVNGAMQLGMIGHSMGGIMVGNLAAKWSTYAIPRPLVLCAMNIENGNVDIEWTGRPFASDTRVLVIVGDQDTVIDPEDSESFWTNCSAIAAARKDWILLRSDDYGTVPLVADHRAPTNVDMNQDPCLNNLDYYGYWKWATALMNTTFLGTDGDYAFDGTFNQLFMGSWSDGHTVRFAVSGDTPVW
jgi:dienelactone hydrolase